MEGRDHPAVENGASYPLKPPKSPPAPSPPPVPERSETYIVQIPRDQIYRVPPPENSKIMESYRTLPIRQKRTCGHGWLYLAAILLLLAICCGITFGIYHVFYNPKAPIFSITSVHVKNSTSPHSVHANPSYEISLKVVNPNERIGVSYGDGGLASISYDEKTIGKGKYSIASQDATNSMNVHLTLAGLNSMLPNKVEKSMKEKEAKTHIELSLAINVPIKLKGITSTAKKLKVTCEFVANTLATGTKISSQDCISEI